MVHPLDPLTAEEIEAVATAIRGSLGVRDDPKLQQLRFVAITLKEPSKGAVAAYANDSSTVIPRRAFVVTLSPATGLATEHLVEFASEASNSCVVVSSEVQPAGTQPLLTPDDCDLAEEIAQSSPELLAALEERYGIADMKRVACDPWSVHLAGPEDKKLTQWNEQNGNMVRPARLVQTFLYHRQLDRPTVPIPDKNVNYHRELLDKNSYIEQTWRQETLAALDVVQPEGPSFVVKDTYCVDWQKWSFRVGFNYREGLVLHDLCFEGRPVVYRASLVEMAVPYADPYPPHQRKCAFDVGDYGLGYCANSLELGCDCLGHIHYFDSILVDAAGKPQVKKKAVCMHEEDNGLLWKHVEYRNGHNESRRSRELIISSIATVVNYEYLFYWRLKQDGTIEYEVKLSGELSTNVLSEAEGDSPTHGIMVAPGVNAQIHQHMFCARLDMAVDGLPNTVSEVDVVHAPPDATKNPYGNVFYPIETPLETETKAIRVADMTKARTWKIASATETNPINGKPTAFKLVPFSKGAAQPLLMVDPSCAVSTKGAFAKANLWVTPFADDEEYPAGKYTPQGDGSVGLPDWTAKDRPLVAQDVVLWHAFGVCHVPRLEDFPVMPCEITGFSLKPDNFFQGNPAIDLPPDKNDASELSAGCCSAK